MKHKSLALFLTLTLSASILAGCTSYAADQKENRVIKNETISPDSKWICASIDGAIDEDTPTNLKDDFYLAINKDWILEQEVDEETTPHIHAAVSQSQDLTKERLLRIISGEEDPKACGNVEIAEDEIKHDQALVSMFADKAGDWAKRDADGVEPLRPYLEAIDQLQTTEDLQNFVLDQDYQNLSGLGLVQLSAEQMLDDMEHYHVLLRNAVSFSLSNRKTYMGDTYLGGMVLIASRDENNADISYVMSRLGYSQDEIDKILHDCYKFESDLADHIGDAAYYSGMEFSESNEGMKDYSLEEIRNLQGTYPMDQLISIYGYDTDTFRIMNKDYLSYVGKIFNEKHLDELKAYYKVLTIKAGLSLLDHDTLNAHKEHMGEKNEKKDAGEGDVQEQEIKDDNDLLLQTVRTYLSGPLDMSYIADYCTKEEKEDLTKLTEDIIDYYHTMILEEEWLSDATKEKAIEKLENMTLHIVYPDEFLSYDYYSLEEDDGLLEMVAKINAQSRGRDACLADTEVDRSVWNLDLVPATTVNCCYQPSINSINIMAAFLSDSVYSIDQSKEEKYAMMGTIIGHEITHGFDNTGAKWDKYGNLNDWWTMEDKSNFYLKAGSIYTFYNAVVPYPGATPLNGSNVAGEAIADMGGMKCTLGMAKQDPDFDYDAYFKAYEQLWAEKGTYPTIAGYAEDVHPLGFLRGNITVQQFDEFYETYDIKEGDGMYLPPEKRIGVW